jgi:hypothetical protein
MKKYLLILIIVPAFCKAQKIYNITGISSGISSVSKLGVGKSNQTITVTDSTFIQNYRGKETVYNIVKKVSANYFKVTDGLKDYIVRISDLKYKKYNGIIVMETDKGDINMWYE